MGDLFGRNWYISQVALRGDEVWFLWKWSDENVKLYQFDLGTTTFTLKKTFTGTSELPNIQQGGISYDGSDILFFVIGA